MKIILQFCIAHDIYGNIYYIIIDAITDDMMCKPRLLFVLHYVVSYYRTESTHNSGKAQTKTKYYTEQNLLEQSAINSVIFYKIQHISNNLGLTNYIIIMHTVQHPYCTWK